MGAAEQQALVLSHGRIKNGKSHSMKHQIPLAEIGIFPCIRHGDDVMGMQASPIGILTFKALWRWRGSGGVPF